MISRTALIVCCALALAGHVPAAAQGRDVRVPACDDARAVSGSTEDTVSAAVDSDGDGLTDACELALARTFAPVLTVRAAGCDADPGMAGTLAGGYVFAVQPVGYATRIAYLPAYFRDCGWRGAKCLLPFVDCAAHDGDSEAIIVEVARTEAAAAWSVEGVFLSAHCFGRSPRGCRWYRGADLEAFDWDAGAPIVWVAEGRHANYPTWQACDAGHRGIDTCDRHDARYRFPVDAGRNIGSRAQPAPPGGCIAAEALQHPASHGGTMECFWDPDMPFRGWQRGAAGVTPYARYLGEIAGF